MRLPKNAKEIPEFPGYYATSDGDIWSGPKEKYRSKIKKLSPRLDRDGYLYITPYRKGKKFKKFVHYLMLCTFIGSRPKGLECRHLDGDPRNNDLNNLCWGTKKENGADRIKHGTSLYGEKSSTAKLNKLQVRIIKYLLKFPKEFT